MIYGSPRVSTDRQSVTARVAALKAAGAETAFREVASGAKSDRPQRRCAVATPAAEDGLTVTRLDHLARSARAQLNTLAAIIAQGAASGRWPTHGQTPPPRAEGPW